MKQKEALRLFLVLLGALREAIFKSIAAHMAQHGHTWHDLCTLMITYVTTCECHDHTLHIFCMHIITHGTVVAVTLHSTTTNDTTWAQMSRSPLAMSCTLSHRFQLEGILANLWQTPSHNIAVACLQEASFWSTVAA